MTKKEFKEKCSFQEYGKGSKKRVAIYYDYKLDISINAVGYKYMVKARIADVNRTTLFNALYDWVINGKLIENYWIDTRFAPTEDKRFKISLMG